VNAQKNGGGARNPILLTIIFQLAQIMASEVKMKTIIKRHKLTFTRLYQSAKENDLEFTLVRQMSLVKHQLNKDKQVARKEGVYLDWQNSQFDGALLMIPTFTKQTHRELGYQVYLSKAEIPDPYKCLWTTSTQKA